MRLIEALRSGTRSGTYPIATVSDYAAALSAYGSYEYTGTVQQTLSGQRAEPIPSDFAGLARGAFKRNGVIFSCMLVRQLAFSAVRFQYQRLNSGKPSELFGTPDLALLEEPWAGGTTQDMLSRMSQDADLAGNSYWTVVRGELVRMRPDWVQIILSPREVPGILDDNGQRPVATLGWEKLGYVYTEGGAGSGEEPVFLLPDRVSHFAPIPDPEFSYRGMSWVTPLVREIQADGLMTQHRMKFFENGATPNMVIRHPENAKADQVRRFRDELEANHAGVDNAYKTLHLGGGADVTVVGANLQEVEFHATQGHGETRIAAAAGVPPVIVGLSEGLQAATYSNYAQARRRFADGTMHPLWQNAAGSLAPLLKRQGPGTRLWYDARDVPFLREDEKDAAAIQETRARTIRTLVDGGYTPESAQKAVLSNDFGLLVHTGFFSVQLRPAGEMTTTTPTEALA